MRGDLATGEGIDAAVSDAGVIVHLAGRNKGDDDKARQLVRAAGRAGRRQLVYISVVGADRLPMSGRLDSCAVAQTLATAKVRAAVSRAMRRKR